jgi:VWFA-related protein
MRFSPCYRFAGRVLLAVFFLAGGTGRAQKKKPAKPQQLDSNIQLKRDAGTGELHFARGKNGAPPSPADASQPGAIRVGVSLVQVGANVVAADGNSVRDLSQKDFRVFEDGVEQKISYFDASTEPAHVALILDSSPSVLPDSVGIKQAARELADNLAAQDEIAIAEFSAHTYLLAGFTRDRGALERAIASIDVRTLFGDVGGSNIYEAVYLAAREVFPDTTGRKAIVLLTDGQDSGLGLNLDAASMEPRAGAEANRLTFEDVVRALAAQGIEVQVISTQNRPPGMTEAWLADHSKSTLVSSDSRDLRIPAYTVFLAELVRRVGGQLYFLREQGTLSEIYRRIGENLRAQYTLGFYPVWGSRPGWHQLRVEVLNHPGARVVHRVAYYVPAGQ